MPAIRSRSRGWALQVLYAWESRGEPVALRAFLAQFLSERRVSGRARGYIITLIEQIADHRPAIDRGLQDCLHNWRLERLSVIDRNVLRIGAAELLYLPDIPPRVAIQEAILLAEKYGTAQSPRFVNGVLDALMRAAPAPGEGS
ncbi:MAG: transcription antitermination factor NusB [Gemmatimonadetes bacterium]|nr:transcription antitermination factor NusB [Gemmatimonadota bacterium]